MNINYVELFNTLHPGFFDRENIRNLPPEDVSEEQILDLHSFSADAVQVKCPGHITFGMYHGDMEKLRQAVALVDESWVEYFNKGDKVYCAMDGEQVVSFCLLDVFGEYKGLKVAGPGCVGTVPGARGQGIGLKMVQNATQILKEQGYDLSYIHYTHVGRWYARLGYETILRWNAKGLCTRD